MMPHEYGREIHTLQTDLRTLKRYFEKQITDICFQLDQLQEDVMKIKEKSFDKSLDKAREFRDSFEKKELADKLTKTKEEDHGFANKKSPEGFEERPKGHKKASKDG